MQALDGAATSAGLAGLEPAPPRDRHARRVRPHDAAAALRPPPARAGTTRTCSSGSPTRSASRSTSTTTSTSPPSPSCAVGRRPRRRRLRPAVGRRGPRRRDRHRRPAARRRDRRRRRGRLPAAARHPLVRDVRRGNAGGFQELAGGPQVLGAGALAAASARRTPQAAVARRSTTPGAGDELLAELAHRVALGLAAIVAVVDPALVVLSGGVLDRRRRRGCATWSPTSSARWRSRRPRLELAGVPRRPGAAPAPCTPRSPRPATRSSTPSGNPPPTRAPTRARHQEITMTHTTHSAADWPPAAAAAAARPRGHRLHRARPRAAPTTTRTPTSPSPSGTAGARRARSRRSRQRSTRFEKAHPNIHVKAVGNITDDKINQALRAGGPKAPDVVSSFTTDNVGEFCTSHAFVDLNAVPEEVRHRPGDDLPAGAARLHAVPGQPVRAAAAQRRLRPLLQQGRRSRRPASPRRPRPCSEFDADAVKLTKTQRRLLLPARLHAELPRLRVDDHALRGAVRRRRTSPPTASPTSPTTRRSRRPSSGRRRWSTSSAAIDKLEKYRTTFGDEFGAKNPFMTGQVAMAHRRRVARPA